jgi:hypothetical protein
VFHSIRKTVGTLFEQAEVLEGVAADILGHEKQTMTYGLYSGGSSMKQKRDAMHKLKYPTLCGGRRRTGSALTRQKANNNSKNSGFTDFWDSRPERNHRRSFLGLINFSAKTGFRVPLTNRQMLLVCMLDKFSGLPLRQHTAYTEPYQTSAFDPVAAVSS